MKPETAASYIEQIQAALQQQNIIEARRLLALCVKNPPRDQQILVKLWSVARAMKDGAAVTTILQRMEEMQDSNPQALMEIAIGYMQFQAWPQARKLYTKLAKKLPHSAEIDAWRARVESLSLHFDDAIPHYRSSLKKDPKQPQVYFELADIYERKNNLEEAEKLLDAGLAIDPKHPQLISWKGRIRMRQGVVDEARKLMESVTDHFEDSHLLMKHISELGKACDKLNDASAAWGYFSKANDIAWEQGGKVFNLQQHCAEVESKTKMANKEWVESWEDIYQPEEKDHNPIFLVGFPRSGTTLLDQILSSHPALRIMEEKECLGAQAKKLGSNIEEYSRNVASLNQGKIKKLRYDYFKSASQYVKLKSGEILVDKLPLNIVHIDLIARLFPDAKIVFSLRHPCDVLISNFIQTFQPNPAMAHFMKLDSAVCFYDYVIKLWKQAVEVYPIQTHILRYESLVDDFEGEVKNLLKFLELPWDEGMKDYHKRAAEKGFINTPSYTEVVKPINNKAVGRWKKYREQFEPLLPQINPHLEYFGYEKE